MRISMLAAVIGTALLTTSAYAHDDNNCDVNLDGQLKYNHGVMTVTMDNGDVFSIDAYRNASLNGEDLALTGAQQVWVDQYYDNINEAVPVTVDIAMEGIEIANKAVIGAFTELLGEDDSLVDEFDGFFTDLRQEVSTNLYASDGSIQFDSAHFDNDWMDNKWEQEFEQKVESLMERSIGKLLMSIGSQMLTSGEGLDGFEARMERFGEQIEQTVEADTAEIEAKADYLCQILVRADEAENHLSEALPELSTLNLIDVEHYPGRM